jgi:hypothetical protein
LDFGTPNDKCNGGSFIMYNKWENQMKKFVMFCNRIVNSSLAKFPINVIIRMPRIRWRVTAVASGKALESLSCSNHTFK